MFLILFVFLFFEFFNIFFGFVLILVVGGGGRSVAGVYFGTRFGFREYKDLEVVDFVFDGFESF